MENTVLQIDCILHIGYFLSIKDNHNLILVNKHFNSLCNYNYFWYQLNIIHFPYFKKIFDKILEYKKIYLSHIQERKFKRDLINREIIEEDYYALVVPDFLMNLIYADKCHQKILGDFVFSEITKKHKNYDLTIGYCSYTLYDLRLFAKKIPDEKYIDNHINKCKIKFAQTMIDALNRWKNDLVIDGSIDFSEKLSAFLENQDCIYHIFKYDNYHKKIIESDYNLLELNMEKLCIEQLGDVIQNIKNRIALSVIMDFAEMDTIDIEAIQNMDTYYIYNKYRFILQEHCTGQLIVFGVLDIITDAVFLHKYWSISEMIDKNIIRPLNGYEEKIAIKIGLIPHHLFVDNYSFTDSAISDSAISDIFPL